MLVQAIAAVDQGRRDVAGDEMWRTSAGMTHDHDIRAHRFKSLHRIVKRLPFGDARLRHVEVVHIRRELFSGELESRPRPRRVLVKYVEDRLSAERRDLFEWSARDIK